MNTAFPERYQAGSSLLHCLDARVKLVVALLLMVGIVVTPERAWLAFPLLWTLVGSLAAIGHVSIWRLGRMAGFTLPFMLAAVTLLITTPGNPILMVANFTVTDAGLARFLGIALKSWLSVQVALLLSMTTAFTDLLRAMESLGVPATLVAIIGFMYRYLFVIKDEAARLLRARAARSGAISGFKPGGSLLWRARVAGGMVGSLFLRSYERSERVYAAMLARGYNGQQMHLAMPPVRWQTIGLGTVPVVIVILIQIAVRL